MSTDVLSKGFIVPLAERIRDYDEVSEALYDAGAAWQINYEGTLAYTDTPEKEGYGLFLGGGDPRLSAYLRQEAADYGLELVLDQARPYVALWYNGSDSDMNTLTLDEFQASE